MKTLLKHFRNLTHLGIDAGNTVLLDQYMTALFEIVDEIHRLTVEYIEEE
jgi:hypothetical protein